MNNAKIISVSNQKGGVGKTTTAVHLTQALTILGKKVLLVDMDPQANATMNLGITHAKLSYSITDVIESPECLLNRTILRGGAQGFDILPGHISLAETSESLLGDSRARLRLATKLEPLKSLYDYIIIDTPPSCWSLLFYMSVQFATKVIVPVDCAPFALDGIKALLARVNQVQETTNPQLSVLGFLLTMVDRTNIASAIAEGLQEAFGTDVFQSTIRRTTKLKEVSSAGQTLFHYDPRNPAAQDYMALASEVIGRCAPVLKTMPELNRHLVSVEGGVQ